jgi:peptidoglycan/xylan/chitin deacetylase (PgdA/CDA1 family)
MVLVAASAVLGGAAATAAYGIAGKSSQLFSPSVYRGPSTRRSLALTFDDGPSEGTPALLEYLDKRGITATFFQCGLNVKRLPHVARQVAAAGHEIGNHTWSHPRLYLKSPRFIDREFTETQRILADETGTTPALLRPPYGFRWFGMRAVQRKLGLLGILWTAIGNDWKWPANRIAAHILSRCAPGGIICLHDGRDIQPKPDVGEMLSAVKQIVPVLQDQGYRFETVSELLLPEPVAV